MSQSGALAASSRIGVARGVHRLSPARLRKRPVAVWVRGSILWGRREACPTLCTTGSRKRKSLPVDAETELHLPRRIGQAAVGVIGSQHAEVSRIADIEVRIVELRVVQKVRELEDQSRADASFLPESDVLGYGGIEVPGRQAAD